MFWANLTIYTSANEVDFGENQTHFRSLPLPKFIKMFWAHFHI